jgi:hypothetical protein
MDKKTSDIIQQIRKVAAETGLQGKHKALAEELNKRGIKTSRGVKWSPQGLANICNRHGLFKGEKESAPVEPVTPDTAPEEQTEPEEHVSTPQPKLLEPESLQLDVDTIATLKEIAQWWKSGGAAMVMRNVTWEPEPSEPTYRAIFPGGKDAKGKNLKKNTGIRVNLRLLEDAVAKAETPQERIKTGGSLSPLIERLLWQYLEFDPKYLTRDDA